MRILIVLLMLLSTTTVWSSHVVTDGLSDEQKAEIALQVAQVKAKNKTIMPPDITPKDLQEYAALGESIAGALGACAKEMGVAVNDFADSKVGTIATILIVWKVAGEDIMGFVVGISLFMIGLCVWFYLFRKMCVIKSVTYHENGKIEKIEHYGEYGIDNVDNTRVTMMFVMLILIAICLLIMFF